MLQDQTPRLQQETNQHEILVEVLEVVGVEVIETISVIHDDHVEEDVEMNDHVKNLTRRLSVSVE